MTTHKAPQCPRCQGTELKLVSEKHRRDSPRSRPLTTLSIYRCTCGTGFTHMVKHELAALVVA